MASLLQDGHFFLEPHHLQSVGVGHEEALDGHLSVPVPSVHLAHTPLPYGLIETDVLKRDVPLIHHAVPVLEGKKKEREGNFFF